MENMTIRPMTAAEQPYCYSQEPDISLRSGLIGHLRADMDTDGNGFFSTWDDYQPDLKTPAFKAEFDEVINALRKDEQWGGILTNRNSLSHYCNRNPENQIIGTEESFGFRADTEKYSYMLRLNPLRGEYNLYCYAYRREWLDSHMKQAERGIRIIDPNYMELFRIADGDKIRIRKAGEPDRELKCRYIDDYHMLVDNSVYHICEFAERMQQQNATVIPIRNSLPQRCYSLLPSTGEVIIISRGERGYYHTNITFSSEAESRDTVNKYNAVNKITPAQEQAMLAGSLFGFEVPAADPKNYDAKGRPIPVKQADRGGEAR